MKNQLLMQRRKKKLFFSEPNNTEIDTEIDTEIEKFSTKIQDAQVFEVAQVKTSKPLLHTDVEKSTLPKPKEKEIAPITPKQVISQSSSPLLSTIEEEDFNDLKQFLVYQEPTSNTTPKKETFSNNSNNPEIDKFGINTKVFELIHVKKNAPVLQSNIENSTLPQPKENGSAPISSEKVISQSRSPVLSTSEEKEEEDFSDLKQFMVYQKPSSNTKSKKELFSTDSNNPELEKFSTNTQIFEIFQPTTEKEEVEDFNDLKQFLVDLSWLIQSFF